MGCQDGFRKGIRIVSLFITILSLKRTNGKERFIFQEGDIHRDEVFPGNGMEAFITTLVERIPNKDTFLGTKGKLSLVETKAMDKCSAPKYLERDIKYKASGKVRQFGTVKRSLEVENAGRHPIYKMSYSQDCISS